MKRETTIKTGAWPHKASWNQQQLKRGLEQSFRIVKQLPVHFAPQQIQEKNKTGKILSLIQFPFAVYK